MKNIRLEDDFYLHVNGEWLDKAVIPSDKPLNGAFVEIMIANEETLMADLAKYAATGVDKKVYDDALFDNFIALYKKAIDRESRDKENNKLIKSLINEILNVNSYESLQALTIKFIKAGLPSLLSFSVRGDMKNASMNTLYLGALPTILPDKSYYDSESPAYASGKILVTKYEEVITDLLNALNIANTEEIIKNALSFDALIVPISKSAEESADYISAYNPVSLTELTAKSTYLNIETIITNIINVPVEQIIVTNTRFVDAFDTLVKDNINLIKSWLTVRLIYVLSSHGYTTEDLRLKAESYRLLLTGQQEPTSFEKFTFNNMSDNFGDVVGLYFGKTYFGSNAKKEVEEMVNEFIKVYEKRLNTITWLTKQTREKALVKLSKITAMIGYPDKVNSMYEKYHTDENLSYIENLLAFDKIAIEESFAKYNKQVDKKLWYMGAHVVNAYYDPNNNQIVFPAGILQPPFYSYNQSKGANYGGIGAVIAHEITHAFDTNGARIDEFGNINNWWQPSDFAAFNERAEKMINLFDGLSVPGIEAKCNGKLTVTENIADAAGLSCAYEAGINHKDFEPADFFKGWANIWRFKANSSYLELLTNIDVHSPAYLRGLVQLKNFKPFSDFYKIKPTDGMYIADDKKVVVW